MRGEVLLLGAGDGRRLGCGPKAFVGVAGVPILRRAAEAASAARLVTGLVVVVPPGEVDRAASILDGLEAGFRLVEGAATRQGSAARGLAALEADAVAVHDAARCLCPPSLFDRCLVALDDAEAVLCAVEIGDTIKEADGGLVVRTLDRERLRGAQTPQAFRTATYRRAHEAAASDRVEATDDAALVERLGVEVALVDGDPRNLKVTTPTDLVVAEALIGEGR